MNQPIRLPLTHKAPRAFAAAGVMGAVRERARLAREKQPEGVSGPPLRHLVAELKNFAHPLRLMGATAPVAVSGNPQLVMLLPGFGTHPARLKRMARRLREAGHQVEDWGLGFNFGPTAEKFTALEQRVRELQARHGRKLVLVGWSLGGIFAREIAKRRPDAIAKVVTMGSPFSGHPRANNAWRIYHLVTGHSVERPPVACNLAKKPPVPTVALWSACDGIVSPRSSCGRPGERDKAVALRCGHLGFANSDESIAAVLAELETA